MTPVVGDGRKDGRARKRKPTYWCEGCSKNFGSERNYSVHRARGRACNLIRSPAAGGSSIMSTSTASLFAARHQDAHSEGVISGENAVMLCCMIYGRCKSYRTAFNLLLRQTGELLFYLGNLIVRRSILCML